MPEDDYIIREQWKEQMMYIEGANEFAFQCWWGTTPGVLELPTAAAWDSVVPSWMRGRRDLIVARMRAACGKNYTIEEKP